jgi:predicted permease
VSGDDLQVPGYQIAQAQPASHALYCAVSPGNFKTMGIPLLRGRDLRDTDGENAPQVAVINEAMANRFWPHQDPIGKQFLRSSDAKHPIEIVGVVKNTRLSQLYGPFEEAFYVPYAQSYTSSEIFQVRTTVDPQTMSRRIIDIAHSIDPTMPVSGVRTMARALRGINGLLLFELAAGLTGALGILGLTLAVVGVYGVMSYSVSRRTPEIGIRMALGAEPRQVLGMIFRQGSILIASGLMVGLLAAFAAGRLVSDFLVGITPNDPITYTGVSLVLTSIALLASYVPARRGTRVDPMVALRHE